MAFGTVKVDTLTSSTQTLTVDDIVTLGLSTANFTGNFVWVRAKATSVTAGTISSVLINA